MGNRINIFFNFSNIHTDPIWQPAICSCSSEYSRGTTIQPLRKTKLKFIFTDLGALALSRALVGLVARGMENECHRSYFHPDWSPTERVMFDSLFWGPILAVLQFPVFWSREFIFLLELP